MRSAFFLYQNYVKIQENALEIQKCYLIKRYFIIKGGMVNVIKDLERGELN